MLFSDRLFYGRQFFSPDGDGGGGAGGAGDDDGDGDGSGGDHGQEGNDDRVGSRERGRDGDRDDQSGEDVSGLKSALQRERDTNKAVRKFAADRGISIDDAIQRLTDAEEAAKSDLDRATGERDREKQRAEDALTKLRTANGRSAVTDAATKANAISIKAVFALVRDDLEYDDDGEPTNVDAVMAAAKQSDPALFRASSGKGDGAERDTADSIEVRPGVDRMADAYKKSSTSAGRPR